MLQSSGCCHATSSTNSAGGLAASAMAMKASVPSVSANAVALLRVPLQRRNRRCARSTDRATGSSSESKFEI